MLKFIRFFLLGIHFFLSSLFIVIIMLFRPLHPNNVKVAGKILGYPGRWILNLKMEIENPEHLESPMSVFVSNHQHTLDIFTFSTMVPDRTVTVGKKDLIFIPFFGLMYWITGNILLDRKNKKKAYGTLDKIKNHMLKKNASIWIMPEGTRSLDRGLMSFKRGPFVLAFSTERPIVPIIASSYHKTLDFNKWNPGKVIVKVLPAIDTKGKTHDDIPEFKEKLHEQMKIEIDKLDQRLLALSN